MPVVARSLSTFLCSGLLTLALLASGCKKDNPRLSGYRIEGKVVDANSGDGIGGVNLVFTGDTLYRGDATSNGDGSFTINLESDVPIGELRGEREGYQTAITTVFFDSPERQVTLRMRVVMPQAQN